jgi:hypothetical protein
MPSAIETRAEKSLCIRKEVHTGRSAIKIGYSNSTTQTLTPNSLPMKWTFWLIIIVTIIVILAIKYLPWWALIMVIVGGALAAKWGVQYGMKQLLLLPFKAKGQVLKGANLQVHNVQPIAMPTLVRNADTHEGEFADTRARYHQLKWYSVDVSILPTPQDKAAFPAWEPGEMVLVPPGQKIIDLESLGKVEAATIHDYQIFQDDRFTIDHDGKHLGSQRVKFTVGVQPEHQILQFRYYLELFGQIEFPDRTVPSPQLKSA